MKDKEKNIKSPPEGERVFAYKGLTSMLEWASQQHYKSQKKVKKLRNAERKNTHLPNENYDSAKLKTILNEEQIGSTTESFPPTTLTNHL